MFNMINGLMYKDHDKYEFKLYLYDRHKNKIRELKDVLNRHYIAKMNGIHELTFEIPYTLHSIISGEIEEAVNPNFYDVVPEMYVKLVIKKKSSDKHIKEDFYYIDSAIPSEDEAGKKIKQVTTYLSPYELKYKNLVMYEDVSSLEEVFNRTIGRKTMWSIEHIDVDIAMSGEYTKRRMIDVDNINLLDFFFELVEIFNTVPVFDTVSNKVSFYSYENSGEYTDLTISDEQYLKSIVVQPNYDNIVTRLYCYGADELNFRNVNPTGVDYIEDFSYYMNIDPITGGTLGQEQLGMTKGLVDALKLYQSDINSVEGKFADLLAEQEKSQRELMKLQNGMDSLQTEYKMLQDQLDILNSTNQDGQEVKDKKDKVAKEIREQEKLINNQEVELGFVKQQIETLKEEVDISNHLTDEQLIELDGFIKEDMWIDTTYIDEFDLYRDAKDRIKLLSQPLTTFEIDIVDLLKVGSAFEDWSKLRINNVVKLKHSDLAVDIDAKISQVEYGIDNNELSLTISNDRYMIDGIGELKDLIDTTTSTSTQIDLNKIKWDKAVKTSSDIDHIIDAKWEDIKEKIEVGANNSVEIGRRGIIIRDSENPDNYLVANNGVLAITDDGGETWKHAITSEGIVGERIYGKLGIFAKLRADQIIVGDNGERIPDSVIGSADYWNEMANSVEDNAEVIEDLANSDIMTPKDKLVLEREYYQLTNRYVNMIKDLDKEKYPREYKQLIEEYEHIQKVTEPLLKDMDKKSKYNSREFRETYKSYYDIEEEVTRLIAKEVNEQMQEMGKEIKDELEHFVETTVDPLEDYVNGNITMWFAGGKPTMSNYPVNTWDRDEYGDHIGDLYYDELWGDTYKFTKDISSDIFMWEKIGDNNIAKAMYEASQAKDTADGKRRVFVEQPKTPYDEGDLWTQGVNGHLMVCKTSRLTGDFRLSDWKRATKYTDDAKAIEAVEKAQESLDKIYNITDDGVITNDEKPTLKREWETIKAKYSENIILASKYGIRFANYRRAYEELQKIVEPILQNNDEYYSLDRVLFNAAFKDYYIQELAIGEEIYDAIEYNANEYTDKETEKVKKEMEQLGKELEDKIKDAEGASKDLESTINKITDDNYITKMESELLNQNLQEVVSTANEIIDIADSMYLRYSTERIDYYNSIFGNNKLKDTLEKYINKVNYPIYVGTTDLDKMKNQFEDVGKTRELLTDRIEKERNKLLKGEIDKDIYEAEQKAEGAKNTAEKAESNFDKISNDNYITLMESELLNQDLEAVIESATQLIEFADSIGLKFYTERQDYYNSVFGKDGIKELLSPYIDRYAYPIYMGLYNLEQIKKQFGIVEKNREKLADRIVRERDNILNSNIQVDIKNVDNKVQGAKDAADKAQSIVIKISEDKYITKMESELLNQDLTELIETANELLETADSLGLTFRSERRNYYNAVFGDSGIKQELEKYIGKSNYPIYVGDYYINQMNDKFKEVNKTREILSDKIITERDKKVSETADNKIKDVDNRVQDAKDAADKAQKNVNNITKDNYITKMESELLRQDLSDIVETANELIEIADSLGLSFRSERRNYYNAVFGSSGIKQELEKYIGKSSYPIYVGTHYVDEIDKKFKEVGKTREILSNKIITEKDKIISDSADGKIKDVENELGGKIDDVEKEINENLPATIEDIVDMNPDLIRASRKYSDVQITKERGVVASHSHGEYTQLNGSGLMRYIPHPIFEDTPTNERLIWYKSDGEITDFVIWDEGHGSFYDEVDTYPHIVEGGGVFYTTAGLNKWCRVKGRLLGKNLKFYIDGYMSYKTATSSEFIEEITFDTGWMLVGSKGWHEITWEFESPRYFDVYMHIDEFMYDNNKHVSKLVGWKDTGYKYGYRVHVGEASSNPDNPRERLKIQLPIDFIMDNASNKQGFDVFLSIKSYNNTMTGFAYPYLYVVEKNYELGTFDVVAYVYSSTYSGSGYRDVPMTFTYIAVAKK